MARCLLALLPIAVASGPTDDAVSLLQSVATGAVQPSSGAAVHHQLRQGGAWAESEELALQTYVVGETAEVKTYSSWAVCHVVEIGADANTYDVVVPGTVVMKGVPAIMLRKRPKASVDTAQTPARAELDSGPIDGETGEHVEILVRKGRQAGHWVPGWIVRAGDLPDHYNIRVWSKDKGLSVVRNVPGASMRKAVTTTTPAPEDLQVSYKVGDAVEVRDQNTGSWTRCQVMALGSSPDTFTVYIPEAGWVPDVPRRALRLARNASSVDAQQAQSTKEETEVTSTLFEVGEHVEAKVMEGPLAGFWLKAKIMMRGHIPFTYWVDMTQWKLEDLKGILIYQELLRRPGQLFDRAAMTSYELGEKVEFKLLNETGTYWLNATISDKGKAGGSWGLTLPNGQEFPSVPVELMRKSYFDDSVLPRGASNAFYTPGETIEYRNILTGSWMNGTIKSQGEVPGTYEVDPNDTFNPGTILHWMPPEILRRPASAFREGDAVEVEGTKNNQSIWSRAMVTGAAGNDTYNVTLPDLGLITGVKFCKMRRANPVAERQLLVAYEIGEKAQMKVLYGPGAGSIVSCVIVGRGNIPSSYNVSIRGAGISPNVPIELLRKLPSSRFKVGEFVKVRIASGVGAGTWAMGMISGKSPIPDMFNISYWKAGMIPNVALELITKHNKPYMPEQLPYFEIGSAVKVRIIVGPEIGNWYPGVVKGQSSIMNTSKGPRPELYTIGFPSLGEDASDVPDVPVELLVRDDKTLRPMGLAIDIKPNDTVQLKGFIGPKGALWTRVYVLKNGTKRESYDVHLPGVGIFPDIPIELIRRAGSDEQIRAWYQAGDRVEVKDIFDLSDDGQVWCSAVVSGFGRRPNTYDILWGDTQSKMDSVPVEILRKADGQEYRIVERIYSAGDIVEVKDILGVMDRKAVTKETFKVLREGSLPGTFDIQPEHAPTVRDVPAVLMKKIDPEEASNISDILEVGDFADCVDVDKPNSKLVCLIVGEGEEPGSFNVQLPNYKGMFPNIPVSRLFKRQAPKKDSATEDGEDEEEVQEMMPGDLVEVYDSRKKDSNWVEAVVMNSGAKKNTLDVKIGEVGVFRSVPLDKVRWRPRKALAPPPTPAPKPVVEERDDGFSVGDTVRYRGPGVNASNSSTWVSCVIVGEGQVPYTFNLGTPGGFVINNIPFFYLQREYRPPSTTPPPEVVNTYSALHNVLPTIKTFQAMIAKKEEDRVKELEGDEKVSIIKEFKGKGTDPDVEYHIGEQAEVMIVRGEHKGLYVACEITGTGKFANTYNIHIPGGAEGARDIVNVGTRVLRKIMNDDESKKIKAASSCTEDDRHKMMTTIVGEGLFNNLPQDCNKVMGLMGGINSEALTSCAQSKFAISTECTACPLAFAKDVAGQDLFRKGCMLRCMPVMEACENSAANREDCVAKLGDCMSCTQTPLLNLLRCVGVADSMTGSKLEQVNEAVKSGRINSPGTVESIFGADWVASHRSLLEPFLGPTVEASARMLADAEQPGAPLATFKAGDKAEIRIQKGAYAGHWVDCEITGSGHFRDTYNVHVPSAPASLQDFPDVSALILRKSEGSSETVVNPAAFAEDPA